MDYIETYYTEQWYETLSFLSRELKTVDGEDLILGTVRINQRGTEQEVAVEIHNKTPKNIRKEILKIANKTMADLWD